MVIHLQAMAAHPLVRSKLGILALGLQTQSALLFVGTANCFLLKHVMTARKTTLDATHHAMALFLGIPAQGVVHQHLLCVMNIVETE